jgi:hypothetical protein
LRIPIAKAAEPARGFHALFKCYEAAICTAANRSFTVNRTPRIVLGFGGLSMQRTPTPIPNMNSKSLMATS